MMVDRSDAPFLHFCPLFFAAKWPGWTGSPPFPLCTLHVGYIYSPLVSPAPPLSAVYSIYICFSYIHHKLYIYHKASWQSPAPKQNYHLLLSPTNSVQMKRTWTIFCKIFTIIMMGKLNSQKILKFSKFLLPKLKHWSQSLFVLVSILNNSNL